MTRNTLVPLGVAVGALALMGFASAIVVGAVPDKKTSMIYGKVYDQELRAVPKAMVELRDLNSRKPLARMYTDETGAFKFTDLSAGAYFVVAYRRDLGSDSLSCKLHMGEEMQFRFILKATGR